MTPSVTPSSPRIPSEEEAVVILSELQAILASESFSGSKRCQEFLEFVVRHAITGSYESLTERFLGVELFGRAVDYETATDSIVRVRANDVRRRLAQYYSGEHPTLPVRIDLMAGGYTPEFHWNSEGEVGRSHGLREHVSGGLRAVQARFEGRPVVMEETRTVGRGLPPAVVTPWYRKLAVWSGAVASVLILALLGLAPHWRQTNFDRFWQPVLDASSSPVLSLPTSDTSKFQSAAAERLSQLKRGDSMTIGLDDVQSFHNWHLSLPVVQAALSVELALARRGKTPLVRVGSDLKRDELRGHPIIAIGSFSNPWTERNVTGLRFTFDRGVSDKESPRIRDSLHPQRSWFLVSTFPEAQTKDYAIVTRTFDPVTHETFVSLAGLHSFGNQTAAEFVSQDSYWNELAQRAPKGWEKMNLQVVLETDIIGMTPTSPKIVDAYFWK